MPGWPQDQRGLPACPRQARCLCSFLLEPRCGRLQRVPLDGQHSKPAHTPCQRQQTRRHPGPPVVLFFQPPPQQQHQQQEQALSVIELEKQRAGKRDQEGQGPLAADPPSDATSGGTMPRPPKKSVCQHQPGERYDHCQAAERTSAPVTATVGKCARRHAIRYPTSLKDVVPSQWRSGWQRPPSRGQRALTALNIRRSHSRPTLYYQGGQIQRLRAISQPTSGCHQPTHRAKNRISFHSSPTTWTHKARDLRPHTAAATDNSVMPDSNGSSGSSNCRRYRFTVAQICSSVICPDQNRCRAV